MNNKEEWFFMKEATGELSGTVITVVAIAAVAAIFTAIVLPLIRGSIERRTQCADAICSKATCGSSATCTCTKADGTGTVTCDNPYID